MYTSDAGGMWYKSRADPQHVANDSQPLQPWVWALA